MISKKETAYEKWLLLAETFSLSTQPHIIDMQSQLETLQKEDNFLLRIFLRFV